MFTEQLHRVLYPGQVQDWDKCLARLRLEDAIGTSFPRFDLET
jgi:hypothetical protein